MSKEQAALTLQPYNLAAQDQEKLLENHTNITLTELEEQEPSIKIQVVDSNRPLFLASVWLLGASLRNIGMLYSIQHTTVLQSIRRKIPAGTKQIGKALSLEAIEEYRKKYYENIAILSSKKPREVAMWLRDNTQLDNDK